MNRDRAAELASRERKVDVESLAHEQAEQIGFNLGQKLEQIRISASEHVNKITKIYGIKAVVAIQLIDEKTGNVLR
jgi:hypothetical protein